ncbi:MAG TPA: RidA family protein [Clostridiaceae bacterium]|jgi:enamine deaminase RidA (YjgF/YER057c/UK114 family)|nr:RidA family protein [Clostridiaceae bacterium]
MCIYERIKELGIELPKPAAPMGVYFPAKEFGEKFIYISGQGPAVDGKPLYVGKVGKEVSLEEGQKAAYACMVNVLSVLNEKIKDLNRVKNAVKILGFVACTDNFYDQPKVINAASQLLVDIFGEDIGKASRSAIATNVLPGNIPVEIEALFEIE